MVRIYYQTLVILYLSYLYVRFIVGVDNAIKELAKKIPSLRETVISEDTYKTIVKLYELISSKGSRGVDCDELNQLVLRHPTQDTDDVEDLNLIETLARLTAVPFFNNRVPHNFVTTLRKALCDPTELSQLNQKLRKVELHCYRCEHVFLPNEMVTFVQDPYNKKDVALLCHRCRLPEVVGCDHCGTTVDIRNSYLAKRLARKRWYCERHANPEGRAENIPATPTTVPDVQTTTRNPFAYNGGTLTLDTILVPQPPPTPNPVAQQVGARWRDYARLNLPTNPFDIETT